MIRAIRYLSFSRPVCAKKFKELPDFKLKCGLELHTQLKTTHKLFSFTPVGTLADKPNSKVSFFDIGLPGTQPQLNPEALLLALKAAVALDSDIQEVSMFDRKHYFYPDQPLGYQITQFYKPIARGGHLTLREPFDELLDAENTDGHGTKTIRIQQIQIEQDTGKSIYNDAQGTIQVDLNRANSPLIELVTHPDFENIHQVRSFVKKYQQLVKYLDICTGELETGAIRVDVNISVNGGERVELKNLRSTSDIVKAMEFEYFRQVDVIQQGGKVAQQTRGWNGSETVLQRTKEGAMDYRYFPDSELPIVRLSSGIKGEIKREMPQLPEDIAHELSSRPYGLEAKYVKFLIENKELLAYYLDTYRLLVEDNLPGKLAANWIFNNMLLSFKKNDAALDLSLVPVEDFKLLIKAATTKKVTKKDANFILAGAIEKKGTIPLLIASTGTADGPGKSAEAICMEVISEHPQTVQKIKEGNTKSIKFLVGMAMKKSQGRGDPKAFESTFNALL